MGRRQSPARPRGWRGVANAGEGQGRPRRGGGVHLLAGIPVEASGAVGAVRPAEAREAVAEGVVQAFIICGLGGGGAGWVQIDLQY